MAVNCLYQHCKTPSAASGVVRTDLLHFLAGCRKSLGSVYFCPSIVSHCVVAYLILRLLFCIVKVGMCSVLWLFWLSCQYLPSDWLERLL